MFCIVIDLYTLDIKKRTKT